MELATWKKELINCIHDIANPDELERLWSGKDKSAMWSYDEILDDVLGLYDLDGFLLLKLESSGLTKKQLLALQKFRNSFVGFAERKNSASKDKSDWRVILSDPEWVGVMLLAKKFISKIDRN